jgi:hypothetical protein
MKQKLLMLLAVLLTGGMLVACGPGGDEFADDGAVDGGGGVVEEPLGGDAAEPETFGDAGACVSACACAGADAGAGGDAGAAEDETVELDVEEDAAADADAAVGEEVEADVETEADAEAGAEDAEAGAEDEAAAEAEGDEVAGGGAAPAAGEPVTVTLTQAAEGVAVANIEGAEDAAAIAATDEPNPDLNLTVGQRYEFVYDGEGDLVFLDANDQPLLTTAGTEGTFAEDVDVAAEAQEGRLSFTLTEELAQEIDHYAAGPEEQGGTVNVN